MPGYDAGSGAVQHGDTHARRGQSQPPGNVLFIAATADNYLRAYNMSSLREKLWRGTFTAELR